MRPEAGPRIAVAALSFAVAACLAYTVQRLVDAATEPPMAVVLRRSDIPYYWRVGLSLVHGLGAGSLAWVALDAAAATRCLDRLPWLVPALVLPAALALSLFP